MLDRLSGGIALKCWDRSSAQGARAVFKCAQALVQNMAKYFWIFHPKLSLETLRY